MLFRNKFSWPSKPSFRTYLPKLEGTWAQIPPINMPHPEDTNSDPTTDIYIMLFSKLCSIMFLQIGSYLSSMSQRVFRMNFDCSEKRTLFLSKGRSKMKLDG
jgi:hypothetical protein